MTDGTEQVKSPRRSRKRKVEPHAVEAGSETPSSRTPPIDFQALTNGQTIDLPIVMAPSQPRLFADTVGVSYSFSGFMDLTLLTLRQNLVSQAFTVTGHNEKGVGLIGGGLAGGPLVMEEGTVRISIKTALQLAGIILSQAKLLGLATDEEIEQATKHT